LPQTSRCHKHFSAAGGHFRAQEAEARSSNPKIRRLIFVIRRELVMKVPLSKVNFLHRCD
jgi:hypothetical protein